MPQTEPVAPHESMTPQQARAYVSSVIGLADCEPQHRRRAMMLLDALVAETERLAKDIESRDANTSEHETEGVEV